MNYNNPQSRETASRLAQLFDSKEGERILRLITQLSAPPHSSLTQEMKKPGDTPGKLRVGTWEARDEAGGRAFVRVDIGEPWHLWANVQKIPPKGPRRRVVLIGESAARGYLYNPRFTPAQALQHIMNAACGPSKIEVVDLARTNLLQDQLQDLITQALHLDPDALVIFAGNNWSPLARASEEHLPDMAFAFRDAGSWRGVKESGESPARSNVENLIIREHGVNKRVVNLVDTLYSTGSYSRFVVDRRPEFYKATARNTALPLVCDKSEPMNLSVTTKVPHASADQKISVSLNGSLVVEIAATEHWTTSTCSVPEALVHPGVNQVEIDWPMPVWSDEKQREHVASCLEHGELVEITPIFGLIHSFRVSTQR